MTELTINIYADGAELDQMEKVFQSGKVTGFTTNPTLMKKAGIKNYGTFAKEAVNKFPDVPISFEVFADDFETMEKEANALAEFGDNVFVKIPITNTKGESSIPLIKKLADKGVQLNVTAIFTLKQVEEVVDALQEGVASIVSVFAGRIADSGRDPIPMMKESAGICHRKAGVQLLWASPREVLNIIQAQEVGADIITCTPDLINKTDNFGKDLEEFSLDTVKMFFNDSKELGFSVLSD